MAAFNVLFSSITSKYCFNVPKEFANVIERFDVACSRRSDRTMKTTNVTTYKQNEPSIILLVDNKRRD